MSGESESIGRTTTGTNPMVDPAAGAAEIRAVVTEIRAAVLAVPGVTGLSAGTGVEVATQFAGGKVTGVRLGDPVEVHVEIGPVPIVPVAGQIRVAVRGVLERFGQSASVDVMVDDIALPMPAISTAGD